MTDHAATWHTAILRADTLDPNAAWRAANHTHQLALASPVLRAVSLDGRVSTSGHGDPTGASIERPDTTKADTSAAAWDTLVAVDAARRSFIIHANVVLDWVAGETRDDWHAIVDRARALQPGTIQAGLDVDHDHLLPPAIAAVAQAVDDMAALCRTLGCATRPPTPLERGRTLRLPDSACCTLHLAAHSAYRVPRLPDRLLCQWCDALVHAAGGRIPPPELLDLMQAEDPRFVDELEEWLAA